MFRTSALSLLVLIGWASVAPAQVMIRAPFVRVQVDGGGVFVRAPFVNIHVRNAAPVWMPPVWVAPAPMEVPAPPEGTRDQVPVPIPGPGKEAPPAPEPSAVARPLSLDEFAQSFQPREGSYEIVLLNPVTSAPATVQFSLPAGSPRAVTVSRRELAFDYGSGQWVRIHFDRKGARVTSRL